jgi:hypothetical protein
MVLTESFNVMCDDWLIKLINNNIKIKYALLNNDLETFKKLTDVNVHAHYERMRELVRNG